MNPQAIRETTAASLYVQFTSARKVDIWQASVLGTEHHGKRFGHGFRILCFQYLFTFEYAACLSLWNAESVAPTSYLRSIHGKPSHQHANIRPWIACGRVLMVNNLRLCSVWSLQQPTNALAERSTPSASARKLSQQTNFHSNELARIDWIIYCSSDFLAMSSGHTTSHDTKR